MVTDTFAAAIALTTYTSLTPSRLNWWQVSMLTQILTKVRSSYIVARSRRSASGLKVSHSLIVSKLTMLTSLTSTTFLSRQFGHHVFCLRSVVHTWARSMSMEGDAVVFRIMRINFLFDCGTGCAVEA